MTKRYGNEVPKPIDPEVRREREKASSTLMQGGKKLETDLAEAIKAKQAMVKFNEDARYPNLEVTTEGGQYTRIAYDPSSTDPTRPFVLYISESKDEFYTENTEDMMTSRYSYEDLEKLIADTKYFYGPV